MKVQPTTQQLIAMLYERLPELFDRPQRQSLRDVKPLTNEPNEKLLSAAGTALEVLEKHRQMKGEYPVGMLGVRAAEEIKAAIEAAHGIRGSNHDQ